MKKIIFCSSILIVMSFTACKGGITDYNNIDEIIFARVLSVDKASTDSNNIKVTVVYQASKGGGQSDSGSEKEQSAEISSEGKTIFDAIRNFDSSSDKKIFLGQLDYILFSEDVAKNGLLKYMDFFTRYNEVNLNTDILIAKGATAKECLNTAAKSDTFVYKYLKILLVNSKYLSISSEVKLKDIVRTLDKDYISAYLPTLGFKKSLNINGKKDIELDGYAIFKGDKLAGYLTGKEARGFNWIIDKVTSGVILVKSLDGNDISLEIHTSKTKIIPVFHNNKLQVAIDVDMSSIISEQTSPEDIYNEQSQEYLKNQQEQAIKREIDHTLAFTKELHADPYGIGDSIYHKHPVKWQGLRGNWMDSFSNLEINVEVKSEIRSSYIINKPTRSELEKNK